MKRTLATIAGATALATIALATPAHADTPLAGCGKGQTLTDFAGVVSAIDWSIYTDPADITAIEGLIQSLDVNGDDHYCIKQYKGSNGRDRQWVPEGMDIEDYIVTRIGENKVVGQAP